MILNTRICDRHHWLVFGFFRLGSGAEGCLAESQVSDRLQSEDVEERGVGRPKVLYGTSPRSARIFTAL